ncbi:MAG: hypothetical protein CMN32_17320 [Saprospirales bacterium]|nr:hypothetical protein [Saprospirales bacterium]
MNPNLNTVIIVEDNKADAEITRHVLSEISATADFVHCEDGEQLLEMLPNSNTDRIRFIILDLGLPKLDGKEVLKRLSERQDWQRLPVIIFSSSENLDDIITCYKLGVNAYVSKPANYNEYDRVVKSIHRFWGAANLTPSMGH